LEQLRKESVQFHNAYCASPLCVPARGAFFSGRYPNETGCIINPWLPEELRHGTVPAGTPNLYKTLEQDWDSWHTGKQHYLTEEWRQSDTEGKTHWTATEKHYGQYLKQHGKRAPGGKSFRGMTPEMAFGTTTRMKEYSAPNIGCYEEGFDYYFDGYFANASVEALKNRDRSKPFALNAMFLAPHPPLDIPEPWFSQFRPGEVELPDNVGRWSPNQSPLQLYNLTGAIGSKYSRDDWQKVWPVYLGLVGLLDHCVGMVIEELKRQQIYDDTLLIFTSDHGEMLGSHCLWQKMCMYEESVRTPLFIKFPKSFEPQVKECSDLVSAIDIFPTLCDYLDIPIPEGVSGQSLLPMLRGEANERENIFIQFDGNGARGNFQRAVLSGSYKLIVDIFKDETFLELYDVDGDPQEQVNLAFEPEQRVRVEKMLGMLREHMNRTGDLLEIEQDVYAAFLAKYDRFKKASK
jgi:arylsulfatase A-like enzyme